MKSTRTQTAIIKSSWTTLILILLALVSLGVASRFLLVDWPNFKPIAAIAIFCGYLLSSRWPVLLAICLMMFVSDALLGFYQWPLMLSVYASLVAAWMIGIQSRRFIKSPAITCKLAGVGGSALLAAIVFFVFTNSAVWMVGWYPPTLSGWMLAIVAGLPFFKFTVVGNLCFSYLLFSTYFAIEALKPKLMADSGIKHTSAAVVLSNSRRSH